MSPLSSTPVVLLLLSIPPLTFSQYAPGTPKFHQSKEDGLNHLQDQIRSHPDVVDHFKPETLFANIDIYRTEIPKVQDYGIGIIVNPCGENPLESNLPYDCCMNRFGDGEYAFLNEEATITYDVVYPVWRDMRSDFPIRALEDEIMENINIVDATGQVKTLLTSRKADDEIVVDEECVSKHNPHPHCVGFRKKAKRSTLQAPCTDNNQTVDSMLPCFEPEGGERSENCMQVAYTQSTFVHVCEGEFADDDHCGTYLEIHRLNGSPYDSEEVVLSSSKITEREASGMRSTTISLNYKGDEDKILCDFKESVIRLGSMVLIKEFAPVCCCPATYNTLQREGMFFCPRKAGTKNGPYADKVDTLQELLLQDQTQKGYPFCLNEGDNSDVLMCSQQASSGFSVYAYSESTKDLDVQNRYFVKECMDAVVNEDTGMFESSDLSGTYDEQCPYFPSCGIRPDNGLCAVNAEGKADSLFTFAGEVGRITRMPKNVVDQDALYGVTFNDGRTVYEFKIKDLELVEPTYNYEIWYVQRTPYDFVIQQRKPFRVKNPRCTYDNTNDMYFPFVFLNSEGVPMDTWDGGYDGNMPEPNYVNFTETIYEDDGSRRKKK